MVHITFKENRIELDQGQTVLSALLDHGYDVPHNCRAGACQTCLMQAVEGEVPDKAQHGLKDTLKAQGFFLSCSCEPLSPLQIVLSASSGIRRQTTVIQHDIVGPDVLRIRLQTEQQFTYRAGQYITLWKSDSVGRSYSLASVSELDDFLELHIRRIEHGEVSNWLFDKVKIDEKLEIQDATGDCFYMPGNPQQKLLLAGTGTGLAPLVGIARDALGQNHQGDIHLIHGAKNIQDLYMHQQLIDMARQFSNFHYHASVLQAETNESAVSTDPIDKLMLEVTSDAAEWKAYLCGDVDIVNLLKKKLFLAGASMNNIYTDSFIIGEN